MQLIKEIQSKFMEMTSEISALFKYFEELHTQFSQKERYKIRLAYRLEDIYSKWSHYKEQMKLLENKKQHLEKIVEVRSDQLIKQKYISRNLVLKNNKLEEMIKTFLNGSNRLLLKEKPFSVIELQDANDSLIVLQNISQEAKRSNVFTNALYLATLKVYNFLHQFLEFNFDFQFHRGLLTQVQQQMRKQWKQLNTEEKMSIQFELKKLLGMVNGFIKNQETLINQAKKSSNISLSEAADENWEKIGECLDEIRGGISKQRKLRVNYQKLIKGQITMIQKMLKISLPNGKLNEVCSKYKQTLQSEDIVCYEQQFQGLMSNYVECFKDLIGVDNPTYQVSLYAFKRMILQQNSLISHLSNDIMRIEGGFSSKKEMIDKELNQIFRIVSNQNSEKESIQRSSSNRHQKLDKSKIQKDTVLNRTTGLKYDHKRNKSQIDKTKDLIADAPEKLSQLQDKQDEDKKPFQKKIVKKQTLIQEPDQKIKQEQSPKNILTNETSKFNYQSLAKQIKQKLSQHKKMEVEEGMRTFMFEVSKTIQESKDVEIKLNEMLEFVKSTFQENKSYLEPFNNLGYSDNLGKLKFIYQMPNQINIYQPSFIQDLNQSVIREQPSKQVSKIQQKMKICFNIQTQTEVLLQFVEVGTQKEQTINQQRQLNTIKILQIQVSPVKTKPHVILPLKPNNVDVAIQMEKDPENQVFPLDQKIRMNSQILKQKEQISRLQKISLEFVNLNETHKTCIQFQKNHEECHNKIKQLDELKMSLNDRLRILDQSQVKLGIVIKQKDFLFEQLKILENQKKEQIIREQGYIKQVLQMDPATVDQPVSKQLRQKIIALMNKVIGLNKHACDSMDEMQMNTIKMVEDCEALKNFVCLKLSSLVQASPKTQQKSKNQEQFKFQNFNTK